MNAIDIKNREIILSFYENNVVLEKQSFDFVKKQLNEPFIDEEFSHNIGPDFRARWEIDLSNLNDKEKEYIKKYDKAFCLFNNYFYSFCGEITYSEFQENMKSVNKNKIKIKKYIEGIYRQEHKRFLSDRNRALSTRALQTNDKEIEAYILKSFEDIGKYKVPNKKLYLVLSLNFADWLLCSTAESWTSCLSLEGAYYSGIFTLPGDLSRALLYVTDGVTKEYLGIKTEKIISRSWVILGQKNEKVIVKFYPNNFLGLDLIKKITQDKNYTMAENLTENIYAKNAYVPLFFEKHISLTPYNDRTSLSLSTTGVKQRIKEGSGITFFNKKFERAPSEAFSKLFSNSFKQYVNEKRSLNQDINYKAKECCLCHSPNIYKNIGNDYYCETCFNKLYSYCKHCNTLILKEDGDYCKVCKPLYVKVKCSICENEVFTKDAKTYVNSQEGKMEYVCANHNHTEKKCIGCGNKIPAFDMVRLHDAHPSEANKLLGKWRCKNCYEATKDKYGTCSICKELYFIGKIENDICVNCREKM